MNLSQVQKEIAMERTYESSSQITLAMNGATGPTPGEGGGWPSRTGEESGGGRWNNPPKK